MNDNNKDYIINLRVSRETYEKIKGKAKENGETVSNLVRKVIEDSGEIMQDLSREIFGNGKKFDDIVSYHRVEVVQEIECAQCTSKIPAGGAADIGETKSGRKYYFCKSCRS